MSSTNFANSNLLLPVHIIYRRILQVEFILQIFFCYFLFCIDLLKNNYFIISFLGAYINNCAIYI